MKTILKFVGNIVGHVFVFLVFFLILGNAAPLASKSISFVGELHWVIGVLLGCVWLVIVIALCSLVRYAMHPSAPNGLTDFFFPPKKSTGDSGLVEQYPGATLSAVICVAMLIAVFAAAGISTILASKGVFTYAIESQEKQPMSEFLFRLYMWNTIDLIPLVEVWKTYGIAPPVRPTNFWAQTIVLIFRTAIIGVAISVIVRWIRFNRERSKTD